MKDLVIKKPFGTKNIFTITQDIDDKDDFCLEYVDKKLGIKLTLYSGGATDGGSIPRFLTNLFSPISDKTAHGYIFHDELWRHRYYLQDTYKIHGITFTETNRIMQGIHKQAECNWFERNLTRLGVRWGGYIKWHHPSKDIVEMDNPTLKIEKVEI